ncbi:unnamed protein product, partial [Ectocarpus fasciculatus]
RGGGSKRLLLPLDSPLFPNEPNKQDTGQTHTRQSSGAVSSVVHLEGERGAARSSAAAGALFAIVGGSHCMVARLQGTRWRRENHCFQVPVINLADPSTASTAAAT